MSVLLIFIDGIGLGKNDPERNPFARFPSPFLSNFEDENSPQIAFDGILVPTDPTMSVSGLPQSATGQTALFTGVNAAQAAGRHISGYPTPTLREILRKKSIFLTLQQAGKTATFANAFTPRYFNRADRAISASTWAVRSSDFPFRMVEDDLLQGRAISHDLSNEFLAKLGYDVPIRSAEQAAEILASILEEVDFCLFEYFLTDMIGHAQDMDWAGTEIDKLTKFLEVLLSTLDLERHLVILTSDHGNFEDLSVYTHTENFVPTIVWGRDHVKFASALSPRIEAIAPQILDVIIKP